MIPPRLSLALASVLAVGCAARSQTLKPVAAPDAFDLAAIDRYVAGQVEAKGMVGLQLAIVLDGEPVLVKGYGYGSKETGAEVLAETPFAIGSITKQFTSACILLLAEEGKLAVQDPVAKYYPELTRAADITLYDLMTHASGYPDYYPLDFADARIEQAIQPDALIQRYASGKLDFEPGARYSYSNTGYVILGRVVERVSGMPLGEFMTERLFQPLGMAHTSFEPDRDAPGLATGYSSFMLGAPEPALPEAKGWMHGAGAIYSTAADLARWDLALVGGRVLKPESLALMTRSRALAGGRTKDYGCGLGITRLGDETVWQHDGAVSGFFSFNGVIPRTRSAVVLLVNGDYQDAGSVYKTLAGLVVSARADRLVIQGPPPKQAALDLLHQLQAGVVDRSRLGEAYSDYLTTARLREAAPRLKALGEPSRIEIARIGERGGMEIAVIGFTFDKTSLQAILRRSPDGNVQEFLLFRE